MIGFKTPEERLPSGLILAAIALLIGSLGFMLFVPRPSVAGLAKGKDKRRQNMTDEIDQAKKRSAESSAAATARLSVGDPERLTAQTLARLTQEARARGLTLGAFRPQRVKPLPGMTELPFALQLSGPFPAVRAFATELDRPGSKLVLRSVQLAASSGESSVVTATLGISAFIAAKEVKEMNETKPKTGDARG